MAEGFEPYHVPQQSRREKLRVVVQNHPRCAEHLQECVGLLPIYDPSLLPSDLLTCANLHQPNDALGETETRKSNPISACGGVKEEGVNLMGYVGGVINASSSSTSHHLYMDPQSSIPINPSSIQDMSTNPFLCAPQNLRLFDQSFNSGEVVVFKPEPLSMTHHANNAGGQGLSLSLSSLHTQQTKLPLELNLQRYESSIFNEKITEDDGGYLVPGIVDGGLTSNDTSRSSVPLGPFTGYASILKGSRFLKPAQQLLEELCDVGSGIKFASDSTLIDSSSMESLSETVTSDDSLRCGDGNEHRTNKSKLISMLDEVYRRYKHYCQQVQAVLASFESVAGLGNAAPFANLALKAMFKHFRCLKNAITDQLQFTNKAHNPMDFGKDGTPRFGNSDRGIYSTRLVHNSGQPVWRPQRGLPERAVTVLRAWLFEHFLHPYPTDTDKLMLAKQTGLSRSQVSNWFINARVRVWKPMVEEIHVLETKQAQKTSQREEHIDRPGDHLPTANSLGSENPSTSTRRTQNLSFKNTRNELSDVTLGNDESMHLSHDNLSHYPQVNVGVNGAGGSGGVSLTLGLHQNNWIGLSEPLPINAARHFGLDTNNERYVLGSFGAQNRQFGGSIIEGQHLHDFVG